MIDGRKADITYFNDYLVVILQRGFGFSLVFSRYVEYTLNIKSRVKSAEK